MEHISAMEIGSGMDGLITIIPNLRQCIAPTLNVAYDIQGFVGGLNIERVPLSGYGLWQTSISINAQTTQFHTEKDCTYTVIHVPKKATEQKKIKQNDYRFLFKLKGNCNIGLFSGQCLTHRQSSNYDVSKDQSLFINFASYGNERMYRHLKTSIYRKI